MLMVIQILLNLECCFAHFVGWVAEQGPPCTEITEIRTLSYTAIIKRCSQGYSIPRNFTAQGIKVEDSCPKSWCSPLRGMRIWCQLHPVSCRGVNAFQCWIWLSSEPNNLHHLQVQLCPLATDYPSWACWLFITPPQRVRRVMGLIGPSPDDLVTAHCLLYAILP